jgi:hypothetical protein
LTAPAARSHSGRFSATHFAPAAPPASSSAVHVNRTSRQEPDDPDLHRDHRLHVDGASAVDVAALHVGGERMVRPAFGRSRDDVEVRQQQERLAAGAVSAQVRVDGAATGFGFDDLGL